MTRKLSSATRDRMEVMLLEQLDLSKGPVEVLEQTRPGLASQRRVRVRIVLDQENRPEKWRNAVVTMVASIVVVVCLGLIYVSAPRSREPWKEEMSYNQETGSIHQTSRVPDTHVRVCRNSTQAPSTITRSKRGSTRMA